MVTRVTSPHAVVPKRDIDRLFEELVDDATIVISPKALTRLRGIAYANTFVAETAELGQSPAPPARARLRGSAR